MREDIMVMVQEDVHGPSDEKSRSERFSRIVEELAGYVFCGLDEFYSSRFETPLPREAFEPIQRLIACAVISQCEFDCTLLPENPVIESR
jgi:hypothetical protein